MTSIGISIGVGAYPSSGVIPGGVVGDVGMEAPAMVSELAAAPAFVASVAPVSVDRAEIPFTPSAPSLFTMLRRLWAWLNRSLKWT